MAVGALLNSARFAVGWYAGRMFSLVTSAAVLVALLAETTALYARLARSDAILVAVKDTGPGIDPKKLSGVFDAFVTTKSHGMGLGLAICRTIIERHGGELTAFSDGKKGALFQFVLPTKRPDEAAPGAKRTDD